MRIDCHCDTVANFIKHPSLQCLPDAHMDYQRLREYLDVSFFAVFIDQKQWGQDTPGEFQRVLGLLAEDVSRQEDIDLLLWREQLEQPQHKLILAGMEGAEGLGEHCAHLQTYYEQGLRLIGPTWNYATPYAGSNVTGGGLTEQGGELVRRCNQLGVLLDAAHSSEASLDDMLACSEKPLIDSHTVCAAICDDWPRSINDRQLVALADKGGVACITMVPDFLGGEGGLEQFCRHVEHAVALIGSEHVGIGADYDGAELLPELAGVQKLPAVYDRLRQRGMKEEDLQQVMGGSVQSLLIQVLNTKG